MAQAFSVQSNRFTITIFAASYALLQLACLCNAATWQILNRLIAQGGSLTWKLNNYHWLGSYLKSCTWYDIFSRQRSHTLKEAQGNRLTADDDLEPSKLETNKQNLTWFAQPIISIYWQRYTRYWPSVRTRWLDIGHKNAKKEWGQYPVILTKQAWSAVIIKDVSNWNCLYKWQKKSFANKAKAFHYRHWHWELALTHILTKSP